MSFIIHTYNYITILFYLLQKQIYLSVLSESNQFDILKITSLLLIGIFTSITPCFLSVTPLLISYTNFFNISFLRKKIFYLGLLSSFIVIIIIFYYGSYQLRYIFTGLPIFTAILFIVLGLNLLGILSVSIDINILKFYQLNQFNVLIRSYLLGCLIGFSALPCNASLILTIVLWLSKIDNIIQACINLTIYVFGCLLPFIAILYIPINNLKVNKFVNLWNMIISLLAFVILSTNSFILFQEVL
uniref:Thiol:disulfide interchange protein n=1 Tax=Gayliella sp. TaxID=2575623 RepID=A0A4D6WVG5_9FLOR|nr:Thiol:disulfide interchange protein [Gayliella sp.]